MARLVCSVAVIPMLYEHRTNWSEDYKCNTKHNNWVKSNTSRLTQRKVTVADLFLGKINFSINLHYSSSRIHTLNLSIALSICSEVGFVEKNNLGLPE